jgi:hypothetical protein
MTWETAISIGMVGISFIFAYLASKTGKQHHPMQTLYVAVSILSMIGLVEILRVTVVEQAPAGIQAALEGIMTTFYYAYIVVLIIVIAYLMIQYIKGSFDILVSEQKSHEKERKTRRGRRGR